MVPPRKETLPSYMSLLVLMLVLILISGAVSAQNDSDEGDDGMSTSGCMILGGVVLFSIVFGAGMLTLINRDTARRSMSTKNWTIALVAMAVIVYIVLPALLVLFPSVCFFVLYFIIWVVGWTVFLLAYSYHRRRSVPTISEAPVVFTARMVRFWKMAAIIAMIFVITLIIGGGLMVIVIRKEYVNGLFAMLFVVPFLIIGVRFLKKWASFGQILIDQEKVQLTTGRNKEIIPWEEIGKIGVYLNIVRYSGRSGGKHRYMTIYIGGNRKDLEVSEDDFGPENLKLILFALMYFRRKNRLSAPFSFNNKLGKQWYDAFKLQLEALLPRRSTVGAGNGDKIISAPACRDPSAGLTSSPAAAPTLISRPDRPEEGG